jgi:two-component system, cell cycle sensor histidine kinase and response regulator CckA
VRANLRHGDPEGVAVRGTQYGGPRVALKLNVAAEHAPCMGVARAMPSGIDGFRFARARHIRCIVCSAPHDVPMSQGRILLVEDNAITQKLMAFALETKGYRVLVAGDGADALRLMTEKPELVLLDLVLPDGSGFDLLPRLREASADATIPILACSGLVSSLDDARIATAGFDDVISKPVEPSRLVQIVGSHLTAQTTEREATLGQGLRVVVADDDPAQLKLTLYRLSQLGFEVTGAADGEEALQIARAKMPHVVLADIMMPRLDGFGVCRAMRTDPMLASIPVVLATSTYVEPEDRVLACRMGAADYVIRTPDLRGVVDALKRIVSERRGRVAPSAPTPTTDDEPALESARQVRVVRQLEKQVAMNVGLAQRCSVLSAALSLLSGISAALAQGHDVDTALDTALGACIDAGEVSRAVLFTFGPDGALRERVLGKPAGDRLETLFGDRATVRALLEARRTVQLPHGVDDSSVQSVADASRPAGILVPIVHADDLLGGLYLIWAAREDIDAAARVLFAEALGSHIGLALAVAASFAARVDSEHAARQSMERYRMMFHDNPLPLWVFDRQTLAFLAVNDAAIRKYGYSRDEFLALTIESIRQPSDVPQLREDLAEQSPPEVTRTWRHRTKDGSILTVEINARDFDYEGRPARLVLANDITERQRAEEALRKTEQQLRQAQKMEAIGALAGGVAHDFNNVLSVILSYSDMLIQDLKPTDPMRADLQEVHKAGMRAASLTHQLLLFSRQQVLAPRVLDLNELLLGMDKMLQRLLGAHIDLVSIPTKGLGRVKADPGSIEQVIMNLVVNARDAMPAGGKLTMETANVTLGEEYVHEHIGTRSGPHVMLAVTDTGTGMDAATASRIFEPFFTTKATGKGTGLGLSTVFGIVQQSGGHLFVYSEPGIGTTFKIYLPRVDAAADSIRSNPPLETLNGSETLLLVEDDESLRVVARGILARNGYTVLDARNAGEALLQCESHEGRIDLLLSDVVMPQMSGPQLAKRLSVLRPDMKVLFMSGYTDDSVVRHGILEDTVAYLQKPITPETLTMKVREVLDARRMDDVAT